MRALSIGLLPLVLACAPTEGDDVLQQGPGWEALPPQAHGIDDASTPVQGGTLARLASGTMVAADIDGDALVFLDAARAVVTAVVGLPEHSEPGRLVEDEEARVHVVLRRAGSVATVDTLTHELLAVHPVCTDPRGIDFDAESQTLWVACESGELANLDPDTGEVTRSLLVPDLRDVVVDRSDGLLWVSQLKSADLLRVDRDGSLLSTRSLPEWTEPAAFGDEDQVFAPMVAWRVVPDPAGGVWVLHQRGTKQLIGLGDRDREEDRSPYGVSDDDEERRGGITHASLTFVNGATMATSVVINRSPLSVDLTTAPDGDFVLAVAGAREGSRAAGAVVKVQPDHALETTALFIEPEPIEHPLDSVVVAVGYDEDGRLVTQGQQPFRLWVDGVQAELREHGAIDRAGFQSFHKNAQVGVSCAGCHPEGREDGHTWVFSGVGPRRSQQLGGGLLDTAPFHWGGEFNRLDTLVHEVFERRMGGAELTELEIDQLGEYLHELPAPRVVTDAGLEVVEQGRSLFYSDEVGCAGCHEGTHLTNDLTYDVGVGPATQVPTLVGVGNRLPVMHDGCATTLLERFTDAACGGGDAHGTTSHLTGSEIDALVAFLQTL